MNINPEDVIITSIYADHQKPSQWVPEVPMGVEIYHKPTGITTRCTSERSQHRNKHFALRHLEESLDRINSNIEELIEGYKKEECKFDRKSCVNVLHRYLQSMEDSHLKCVLYEYMWHNGDV